MSITPEMGGGWGRSLSARRAWIEIVMPFFAVFEAQVALRKESVDRNASARLILTSALWSLSARRAWIEIRFLAITRATTSVALRKESVDRN